MRPKLKVIVMDEDSNPSPCNSQPQVDEAKHRESDSQITLNYDSDSELHGEDTLRIDASDDEQQTNKAHPVGIPSLNHGGHSLASSLFEYIS